MKLIRLFQGERRRMSVPVDFERRDSQRQKKQEESRAERHEVREDMRQLEYELNLLRRGQ